MKLAALLLAALVPMQSSAAQPLSDPYQIFSDARAYWLAQRYPAYVSYTIVVRAVAGQTPDARHYSAAWIARSNTPIVDSVSAEEKADPYRPPPGVTLSLLFLPIATIGGPRKGTGINTDLIGVPILTPNYAFAIAPYVPPQKKTAADIVGEIRAEYHDPLPASRANELPPSQLPTIAVVATSTRRYDITLLGIEPYGDHNDYHLKLTPLRDPGRYRLRELWIDERTYATDRLKQDGNFTSTTATRVSWTVTFHDVDGARYIESESETDALGKGGSALHDASIAFENVAPGDGRVVVAPGPVPAGALFEPADP